MICPKCKNELQKREVSHHCKTCGFSMPFVYRGRRIKESEIKELFETGKSPWIDGWIKKDLKGTICGRLVLGQETLSFEAKTLTAKCPCCKSDVYKDKKKWRCSKCEFNINEKLFRRTFSQEEIEKLVFFGYSDNFDNFVSSSTGKIFAGFISIKEDFTLKMNFL